MTSLMTSCTWGSRAMALSSIHERTSAGGAPAPRRPAARTAMRLEHVVAATGLELARALGQGGRVDQALVGEQLLEGVQPALVVARGLALALGVADLGDQLGLELAPLEAGVVAHRSGHAEDAALPG